MTKIVWDEVGERRFETGVDRGVLYPREETAVSWNGLVSIDEARGGTTTVFYQDGIPYLVHRAPGAFAAKVTAFTYPDELDLLIGIQEMASGINLHDQRGGIPFGLSYRTLIGNDVEGIEHGYKIHLIYNVIASPSDFNSSTADASPSISPMVWDLNGIPDREWGVSGRPTAHISIDSRRVDPDLLINIEAMIYGTDEEEPELPDLLVLQAMAMA